MKTVRFTQVVERSGRPQVHSFWVKPDQDREFVRARKDNRVMTVAPRASGQADLGTVGFAPRPGAQVLIFPKSLKRFAGADVVGVKFDLVDQPPAVAARADQGWKTKSKKPKAPKHTSGIAPSTTAGRKRADTEEAPKAEPAAASEPPERRAASDRPSVPRHRAGPPARAARGRSRAPHEASAAALLREVRAAITELRAGKTVAAYQRLEHAASRAAARAR